jgi:hypothetical protein
MEKTLPRFAHERHDRAEPNVLKLNVETAEPNLLKERIECDEATSTYPSTDSDAPS